jgi:pimeloyl-ACP methyl ester carboxylesterase
MTIQIAGLTVETVEPRGPARAEPVLFVHGMWGGAWMWEPYMEFFAARGWRCHALNLRGHHGSRPVPDIGRVSVHDYVADVRAVAEALDRPIVIGHSLGGLIAQKLAELLGPPAVVAVTPAAPRGVLALNTVELARAALRHLPEILGRRPLMPAFEEIEALELNRLPPAQRRAVYERMVPESGRMTFDIAVTGLRVDTRRVRGPMLVVAGADDRITPAKMVRRVARRYGATLREYPGFAHMLLMEPGWERIAGDITDWLETVTRSAGVPAGREPR